MHLKALYRSITPVFSNLFALQQGILVGKNRNYKARDQILPH